MDQESIKDHLSRISTVWALVSRAKGGPERAEATAQGTLLERYHRAVYRYLLGALHSPEAADELFQDFALRLVRGDFRGADPTRGRFRDLVKTALSNLITNHRKRQAVRDVHQVADAPAVLAHVPDPTDPDKDFLEAWRKELLDRAWEALAALKSGSGPPFYDVLRLRSEHPELTSAQVAEQLTTQLHPGDPYTESGIRKTLQRAREQFTDFLVEEVAHSLQSPSHEELEQELAELGFLPYSRRSLSRRRSAR